MLLLPLPSQNDDQHDPYYSVLKRIRDFGEKVESTSEAEKVKVYNCFIVQEQECVQSKENSESEVEDSQA